MNEGFVNLLWSRYTYTYTFKGIPEYEILTIIYGNLKNRTIETKEIMTDNETIKSPLQKE